MENKKIKTSRASQTRQKLKLKKFGLHPTHLMHHQRQLDIDINGYVPRFSDNQMLKI